jgi:hypothetical protein
MKQTDEHHPRFSSLDEVDYLIFSRVPDAFPCSDGIFQLAHRQSEESSDDRQPADVPV